MRVIIPARLSQVSPGQTGIETQDEDSVAWAESNGHAVVAVIPDKIGGRVPPWKRKNLGPWMTDPDKLARYEAIVAPKQDRLSRAKWRDEVEIRQWAEDHRKQIIVVDSGLHWPPADDMELLRWEFGAIKARQEWEEDSKRYRRMQKYLRDNDRLVGRPPFGYRVVCVDGCGPVNGKHEHHKTLEPDPMTAPYALGMVDRYLAGHTRVAIADWLNGEGIATTSGRTWQIKVVTDVLRNPALIGKRKDGKGRTILRYPPILTDMAKWRALQYKLDETPRRGAISPDAAMLAGIIFCDKCQGIMHRRRVYNVRKDGSKQYNVYYRCDGTVRNRSTCRNMRPLAYVEEYVDAEMRKRHVGIITRSFDPGQKDYQDDIDEIDSEIDDLDKDDPYFLTKVTELYAKRQSLMEQLAESDSELNKAGKWIWVQSDETYAHRWQRLTSDQERRQMIIDTAGFKVFVSPNGEPRLEWPQPSESYRQTDTSQIQAQARIYGAPKSP